MPARHRPSPRRRAFTLLEMLVVVAVVASIAVLVVPAIGDQDRVIARAASSILRSDLELVQVLNITRPDDPVVLTIDADAGSWWIASASAPDTPITLDGDAEPYVVVLGADRAFSAAGATLRVPDPDDEVIGFTAQGAHDDFTRAAAIQVGVGDVVIEVTVSAATGTVREAYL